MGYENKQSLSGIITSSEVQMNFIEGKDYAQNMAGRIAEVFWLAEIMAMRGEKEGKKEYIRMAIEKAIEESGGLADGSLLRFDASARDSLTHYWHLKIGSESKDPYGQLCGLFLLQSAVVATLSLLNGEAREKGVNLETLIRDKKGVIDLVHRTPQEVEEVIRGSRVSYSAEEFLQQLSKKE